MRILKLVVATIAFPPAALSQSIPVREMSIPGAGLFSGARVIVLRFSPTGRSLAVFFDDDRQHGGLVLIPADRKEPFRSWKGAPIPPGRTGDEDRNHRDGEILWSSDGRTVVARSQHSILVVDVESVASCQVPAPSKNYFFVLGLSDNQRIVVSNAGGPSQPQSLSLWDRECQKVDDVPFAQVADYRREHPALAWSSAGLACADPSLRCVDAETGKHPEPLPEAHGDEVAISSGARRAVFADLHSIKGLATDGSLPVWWDFEVWDLGSRKKLATIPRPAKPGLVVLNSYSLSDLRPLTVLSPDGSSLVQAQGGRLSFYRIEP